MEIAHSLNQVSILIYWICFGAYSIYWVFGFTRWKLRFFILLGIVILHIVTIILRGISSYVIVWSWIWLLCGSHALPKRAELRSPSDAYYLVYITRSLILFLLCLMGQRYGCSRCAVFRVRRKKTVRSNHRLGFSIWSYYLFNLYDIWGIMGICRMGIVFPLGC